MLHLERKRLAKKNNVNEKNKSFAHEVFKVKFYWEKKL